MRVDATRTRARLRGLMAVLIVLSTLITLITGAQRAAAASDGSVSVSLAIVGDLTSAPTGGNVTYRVTYQCNANGQPAPVTCAGGVLADILPKYVDIDGKATAMEHISSTGSTHAPAPIVALDRQSVQFTFNDTFTAGSSGYIDITARTAGGTTPDGTMLTNAVSVDLHGTKVMSNQVTFQARGKTTMTASLVATSTSYLNARTKFTATFCVSGTVGPTFGPLVADNVRLTEELPSGAVFVESSLGAPNVVAGNNLTWNLGRVPPGNCRVETVVLRFPSPPFAVGNVVTNHATVTADQPGGGPIAPIQSNFNTRMIAGDRVDVTKSSNRATAAPGEPIRWSIAAVNAGSTIVEGLTLADAIPVELRVDTIATGRTADPGQVTVEYSTDNGSTYSTLPGSPFNSQSNSSVAVAPLLAPGTYVTNVRWLYGSVPSGFTTTSTLAEQPGVETTPINPDRAGATYYSRDAQNCAVASFTTAAVPSGSSVSECETVTVGSEPRLGVSASATTSTLLRGETTRITLTGRNSATISTGPLVDPILTASLPADFEFVFGSVTWQPLTSGIATAPDVMTVIPNFEGPGTTLIRWAWSTPVTLPRYTDMRLQFDVHVAPDAATTPHVGTYTISNKEGRPSFTKCDNYFATFRIDTTDRDGDGSTTDPSCLGTYSNPVVAPQALESTKLVKGELDADFTTSGSTAPGGSSDYRLTIRNIGASAVNAGGVFIDILPAVGDTAVTSSAPRGSQWTPYLINEVQGAGVLVEYSMSSNPCRGEVGGPTTNCQAPNWQQWSPALAVNSTAVRALRITLVQALQPGAELTLTYDLRVPLDLSLVGKTAYNSFAYRATLAAGNVLVGSEPPSVPLKVVAPPASQQIGDYVWTDSDRDGVQDGGEPPVFGAPVELWTTGLDGVRATGDDALIKYTATDSLGRYLFAGVPGGEYYSRFLPIPGALLTVADQGSDGTDSDANPSNGATQGWTTEFNFCTNGAPCTIASLDAGYYADDPALEVATTINGAPAGAPGPALAEGVAYTAGFTVSNTGQSTLTGITVTDDHFGDVVCPETVLDPGSSMECEGMSDSARAGTNSRTTTATGTPAVGDPMSAMDEAHYFGVVTGLELVAKVNGELTATPTGPVVPVGDGVNFTFEVKNTGNTVLANVDVSAGDLVGAVDCPQSSLDPDETMVCTATAGAVAGQRSIDAQVEADVTPSMGSVSATSMAHYFGVVGSLELVAKVNGELAATPTGPVVPVGDVVNFTFEVTNTGNTVLANVDVSAGDLVGAVECPQSSLDPDETMVCTATADAVAGQQSFEVEVVAEPDVTPTVGSVSAVANLNYFGQVTDTPDDPDDPDDPIDPDDPDDNPTPKLKMFTAVTPGRVFDTRPDQSPNAIRSVAKQQVGGPVELEVKVTDMAGFTPGEGVGAVSLNVAVTGAAADGYLTVYPCGDVRPFVSSVNYAAGETVANAVIAPVSPQGTICFYSQNLVDIVTDINGWFTAGAGFNAVTPGRVFDTRRDQSPSAIRNVAKQQVGGPVELEVKVTDMPGYAPANGVGAVSLNVAVTGAAFDGYLTVYPCGDERPFVSSVNYAAGETVANAVIAPVSPEGTICFYSQNLVDIVTDINGWIVADAGFTQVNPGRVFDTRPGQSSNAIRSVAKQQVGGPVELEVKVTDMPGYTPADGVDAVSINVAVTGSTADGYLTAYPCGDVRPFVSSVNYATGETVANAVIAPVSPEGTICFYSQWPVDIVADINGWFAR